MRARRVIIRIDVPGMVPARARALAEAALARAAATARSGAGRTVTLRVRVEAATGSDRALADRIARAVTGAIAQAGR
jgi:hypothetical protein